MKLTDKKIAKVVNATEALLDGEKKTALDIRDTRIKNLLSCVHFARVRLALGKRGIAIDFPLPGFRDILIYKFGKGAIYAPRYVYPLREEYKASGATCSYEVWCENKLIELCPLYHPKVSADAYSEAKNDSGIDPIRKKLRKTRREGK